MSVESIMQAELAHLDMLGDLAKRMAWDEDHREYKKRLKAITREGSQSIDRVKNGGGDAAQAAKVKLTWTTVDANVGDKQEKSWRQRFLGPHQE